MPAASRRVLVLSAIAVATLTGAASAQDPYALRTTVGSEAYLWELRSNQAALRSKGTPKPNSASPTPFGGQYAPRRTAGLSQHAQNAMNFWNSRSARQNTRRAVNQPPARPSFVQPASATTPVAAPTTAAKPFDDADQFESPTLSPYLQLFRQDFEQEVSNYHAFVRPELERRENRQRQRIRDSLQAAPAARPVTASLPTRGVHSTRFGNTGSFYRGWQR